MASPPPPAPAQPPAPGNIAAGTLLGTSAFQRAVDEFHTTVAGLSAQLTRMMATAAHNVLAPPTAGGGGGGHAPATFGSSGSAAAQLTAWQRLQAQVASVPTMRQGSSNYLRQFGSGVSSTVFGRARPGTMSDRAANVAGQLTRAGASAVVGAVGSTVSGWGGGEQSYATALDAFSRQMMLSNPTGRQLGGTLAATYGGMAQRGGGQFWSNSASDMFGAALTINQQAYAQNQGRLLNAASTTAMLNPGMGTQAAASMQAKFGTMNAYYTAQMMGLTPARGAGGFQDSGIATMNSIANRVNANIGGFSNLSQASFKAEIAQGGTLATSVAAYGNRIGLSGQEQQAMVNQLAAENKLMSPGSSGLKALSLAQAQKTLNDFSKDPTSAKGKDAYSTMQAYGLPVGSTLSAAQNILQGKQANGYLANSATYLDAAKSAANTLADINSLLQKVLGPLAGPMGAYQTGGVTGLIGWAMGIGGQPKYEGGGGPAAAPIASARTFASPQPGTLSSLARPRLSSSGLGGGASSPGGGSQNASASGAGSGGAASGNFAAALAFGRAHLGDPYVYGADGPRAWDCSSLVQAAWRAGGVSLPRTSQAQSSKSTPGVTIPLSEAAPGDLVFYGSPGTASHVGLVTGPDTVLEAPHTGDVVKYERISQDSSWRFAKRVAGSGGASVTSNLGGGTPGSAARQQSGVGTGGAVGAAALGGSEVAALAAVLSGGGGGGSVGSASTSWTGSGADTAPTQGSGAGASLSGLNMGSYTPAEKKAVALGQQMAAAMGWTGEQFTDLFRLWNQESSWDANAVNKSSGAAGIPQALGHGKVFNLGDAKSQIAWGLNYVKGRYGDPKTAWAHEQAHNWYSSGISEVVGDKLAHLHSGEMVLNANQARDVRRAASQGVRGGGGSVSINFSAGSIVVQMPTATADGARTAAKSFVDFVAADDRVKALMGGW